MVDNIAKLPYNETEWRVRVSKKVIKQTKKLPEKVLQIFEALILDLMKTGPIQHEWPNYSKLTHKRFHCHLNYSYVAVWEIVDKEIRIMEVVYVGSRKDAPY